MSMLSAQTGTKQSSIFSALINNWYNSLKKVTELKKKTSQISGKDFAASQKTNSISWDYASELLPSEEIFRFPA